MDTTTLADWDDELLHLRRIRNAWPNVPTIALDRRFAELEPPAICYTFFDGYAHRAPCAQLHIATDPERLPTVRDPRCWQHEPTPDRLRSSLGTAIDRAIHRLGGGASAAAPITQLLAKLGIERGSRSYGHRGKALSGVDERVADVIARCLVHIVDPEPTRDRHITGLRYAIERANPAIGSRTLPGQTHRHGQSLRTAA